MTKEQTVSDEEQAAMAIKLADNVRQLIRDEVKAALEDYQFTGNLLGHPMLEAIMRSGAQSSNAFRLAVCAAIQQQMQKF